MLICNERLWAVLENFPENYCAGYYPTVQCMARRSKDGWEAVDDPTRTKSLDLEGEQPEVMCLTATHGEPIILAHGHRRMLGMLECADTVWVVHEGGIYAYDSSPDRFQPVLTEKFRAYWQVTAADCGPSAIWFGSDAGTITRFDRQSRQFELLGVVPDRKITHIRAAAGKVWVKTASAEIVLPASLSKLPKLPTADVLQYDGKNWVVSTAERMPDSPDLKYDFRRADNRRDNRRRGNRRRADNQRDTYLYGPGAGSSSSERLAFIKGIYQPEVLCVEDSATLWIKAWGQIAEVSLPASSAQSSAGNVNERYDR